MKTLNIDVLRELGLNLYESKTYLALINCDLLSASEISRKSGVPNSKLYEILLKLIENKMVEGTYYYNGHIRNKIKERIMSELISKANKNSLHIKFLGYRKQTKHLYKAKTLKHYIFKQIKNLETQKKLLNSVLEFERKNRVNICR